MKNLMLQHLSFEIKITTFAAYYNLVIENTIEQYK